MLTRTMPTDVAGIELEPSWHGAKWREGPQPAVSPSPEAPGDDSRLSAGYSRDLVVGFLRRLGPSLGVVIREELGLTENTFRHVIDKFRDDFEITMDGRRAVYALIGQEGRTANELLEASVDDPSIQDPQRSVSVSGDRRQRRERVEPRAELFETDGREARSAS